MQPNLTKTIYYANIFGHMKISSICLAALTELFRSVHVASNCFVYKRRADVQQNSAQALVTYCPSYKVGVCHSVTVAASVGVARPLFARWRQTYLVTSLIITSVFLLLYHISPLRTHTNANNQLSLLTIE